MDNHRHACLDSRQNKVEMKVRQIFNDNCRIWTWPYERFPCAVNWSVHFLIGAGKSYWMRCEQRRTEAATTGLWPLSTCQHSWNVALHLRVCMMFNATQPRLPNTSFVNCRKPVAPLLLGKFYLPNSSINAQSMFTWVILHPNEQIDNATFPISTVQQQEMKGCFVK